MILEIFVRFLENLFFMKEVEVILFIICWVVLVIGVYVIVNLDSLNEFIRFRFMVGSEEKLLS